MKESLNKFDRIILVDTSWVMYRSHWSFGNFSVMRRGQRIPTGYLYGCVKLTDLLKTNLADCMVFVRDLNPKERKEKHPDYKSGRPKPTFSPHSGFKDLVSLCANLDRVFFAEISNKEADDAIACLATSLQKCVIIYSGDDDFLQLQSARIRISRRIFQGKFEALPIAHTLTKFKVAPEHLSVYRTIVGDVSDKLPGITRFPRDLAVKIARSVSSFGEIQEKWQEIYQTHGLTPARRKYLVKLRIDYQRLLRQYTDFVDLSNIDGTDLKVYKSRQNKVKELCDYFDFGPSTRVMLKCR